MELEMASAAARGVPVRRIPLRDETPVPIWDFSRTDELIARGYEIARQEMALLLPGTDSILSVLYDLTLAVT